MDSSFTTPPQLPTGYDIPHSESGLISEAALSAAAFSPPRKLQDECRQRKRKKGPGRPPTARRIWQQQIMKRRLVRLYLYTPESMLNTKQISRLITAVANFESQNQRPKDPLPHLTESRTETRSTQYELSKLLPGGYRQLRPRNREQARVRIESYRRIRRGRGSKGRKRLEPHQNRSGDRPGSILFSKLQEEPPSRAVAKRPRLLPTQPEPLNRAIDYDGSSVDVVPRPSIRISWVREKINSISQNSLTSSVYEDIRSLLSRLSFRSSVVSDMSTTTITDVDISILESHDRYDPTTSKNMKLIKLCCQFRRDCIHQKYLHTAGSQTLPTGLEHGGLRPPDLDVRYGRDIWNQSALHLAAEWASDELAIPLLIHFIGERPRQSGGPDILNIKNIDGETFMHVLVRNWRRLVFPQDSNAASFCAFVIVEGFDRGLRDRSGRTFMACLVDQMRSSWVHSEVESTLESFGHMLGILVSTAGLAPDSLDFIHSKGYDSYWMGLQYHQEAYQIMPEAYQHRLELLKDDIGINEYDIYGRTPLMALIKKLEGIVPGGEGEVAVLKEINTCVSHKPDLRLLDRNGDTALHYAVRAKHVQVIVLLLNSGIEIHAQNLQGLSAMDVAAAQYGELARPGSQDSSIKYAQAQGTLVQLFDSGEGHKASQSEGGGGLLPGIRARWFRSTRLRRTPVTNVKLLHSPAVSIATNSLGF
ncbi:ankyrin [Nemania abortiva]|nr:ankyrin [Nemania abortiva]